MTCELVQAKVAGFLDNTMNDKEKAEFVNHIRSCNECHEELEVYYVINKAVRQLSDDSDVEVEYLKELERDLSKTDMYLRRRRRLRLCVFAVLFISLTFSLCIIIF